MEDLQRPGIQNPTLQLSREEMTKSRRWFGDDLLIYLPRHVLPQDHRYDFLDLCRILRRRTNAQECHGDLPLTGQFLPGYIRHGDANISFPQGAGTPLPLQTAFSMPTRIVHLLLVSLRNHFPGDIWTSTKCAIFTRGPSSAHGDANNRTMLAISIKRCTNATSIRLVRAWFLTSCRKPKGMRGQLFELIAAYRPLQCLRLVQTKTHPRRDILSHGKRLEDRSRTRHMPAFKQWR
ncbi:hypothetical protein SODALDRAFT_327670 [Sodiomyces alkalinus F11]|uniref:Uncharacterized protein n=1 Tax=Sodiomyces alkalinus (strain CBS 110278 / VKM F-3762 / F11) TaxID=1314773 RepID=A0A3N2Q9N3_SODAK|nr:hypothetical protein SODALDRAFT_327670 [Sodiomyces alkalinus F11]ROT43473.1 hypothetical protein SODALDRAFT_327670 [Sodiomyces alkalinus F11]